MQDVKRPDPGAHRRCPVTLDHLAPSAPDLNAADCVDRRRPGAPARAGRLAAVHRQPPRRRAGPGRCSTRRATSPRSRCAARRYFHVALAQLRARPGRTARSTPTNSRAPRSRRTTTRRGLLDVRPARRAAPARAGPAAGGARAAPAHPGAQHATSCGVRPTCTSATTRAPSRASCWASTTTCCWISTRRCNAAKACESPGPHINALTNLGGSHTDLWNLGEAQKLSEEALDLAEAAGAWTAFAVAVFNLAQGYDGLGPGGAVRRAARAHPPQRGPHARRACSPTTRR